jgi:two-component system chemotaxis response regulator CheB
MLTTLVKEPIPAAAAEESIDMEGRPTVLTCPECRGPLEDFQSGPVRELRCRVGHAFSPESLVDGHEETLERTLWAAVVALEEGVEISRLLRSNKPGETQRLQYRSDMAAQLREMIGKLSVSATPPTSES